MDDSDILDYELRKFGFCSQCRAITCYRCDMFLADHEEFDVMWNELETMFSVSGDTTMCPVLLRNQVLQREHPCVKKHSFRCSNGRSRDECICDFDEVERICDRCVIGEKPVFK